MKLRESDLCASFAARNRRLGWLVSPETSGWDLLCCRERDGFQVGVQAKLRPNLKVLAQALLPAEGTSGPDVHAVLVPDGVGFEPFGRVALAARILVLGPYDDLNSIVGVAPLWNHCARAWTPGFEVLLPAGVPGPKQVSRWKVEAVRLSLQLRERGYLTSSDFSRVGHRPAWWVDSGLVRGERAGRSWRYALRLEHAHLLPDRTMPELCLAMSGQPKG